MKKYLNKFNKKIAREIAEKQFDQTLDCMKGVTDSDYGFDTELWNFDQNFEEDLIERDINPTPNRVRIISEYYEKLVNNGKKKVDKVYNSLYSKEVQAKFKAMKS
jgi:hypothetical protein